MRNKICIIVDGYSTGKYYVDYFNQEGFDCFHVQSRENLNLDLCAGADLSRYKDTILNESIEKTIQWIKEKGIPCCIVPGTDSGVELADTLNQFFNTQSKNEKSKAKARINKFSMYKALKESEIRTIKQEYCNSYEEAIKSIDALNLHYPIVVKPAQSILSDGFKVCNSLSDVKKAFDDNLNSKNIINISNNGLLLQEFINGTEYVVDTVSSDGNHVLTDLMKYTKKISKQGHSIYQSADFLQLNEDWTKPLVEYAFSVLDAVGMKYGAAHIELMVDKDGPVLVEINSRLAGFTLSPDFIRETYGHNQVEMATLAYISTERFLKRASELNMNLNKYSSITILTSENEGYLTKINLNGLKKFHSFIHADFHFQIGDFISEPKSLIESVAYIFLQDDNDKYVEEAKKFILEHPEKILTISKNQL